MRVLACAPRHASYATTMLASWCPEPCRLHGDEVGAREERDLTLRFSRAQLDLVMEYDPEWAKQIRQRKFQIYNAQWLEAIERDQVRRMFPLRAVSASMRDSVTVQVVLLGKCRCAPVMA